MPKGLFDSEDHRFVDAISRLVYCNHFRPERLELERRALGNAYIATDPGKHERTAIRPLSPHVDKLVARAHRQVALCQKKLVTRRFISNRDRQRFVDLVFFVLFHDFADAFDQVISTAHEQGQTPGRIGFYERFQRELAGYFALGEVESPFPDARVFACFFQIRRAFHHIHQYIIGSSRAAMQLRARVWESIFTHDMSRYQRALYDRMGDVTTLISGDSGTGKELVARAIGFSRFIPFDETSRRFVDDFTGSFYGISLSALSPTLIESELFGHRRGAFTGASHDRKGYFEACEAFGTVFLDEIGDVDPSIQVKLLRVLQSRQFQRLGSTQSHGFSGKIVAATNRDLSLEMAENRFREDLYFRLCADRIRTPSLHEILQGDPEELRYLVRFIASRMLDSDEDVDSLADEVIRWVTDGLGQNYAWPGNFRELEQCLRNVLVTGSYRPEVLRGNSETLLADQLNAGMLTAEGMMRQYVTRVYSRNRNYEATARRLQVDRRTVKKYVDVELLAKLEERFGE